MNEIRQVNLTGRYDTQAEGDVHQRAVLQACRETSQVNSSPE